VVFGPGNRRYDKFGQRAANLPGATRMPLPGANDVVTSGLAQKKEILPRLMAVLLHRQARPG
jgi:hypothetical protein